MPVEEMAGLSNQHFGVTMVVSDFDQNGWPDVVLGNLDSNLRAFLNEGGDNHWLKVRLPDAPASIGARLKLETASGKIYSRQFYTSEGLGSDQTRDIFFGLGAETAIKSLQVQFQDSALVSFEDLFADSLVVLE